MFSIALPCQWSSNWDSSFISGSTQSASKGLLYFLKAINFHIFICHNLVTCLCSADFPFTSPLTGTHLNWKTTQLSWEARLASKRQPGKANLREGEKLESTTKNLGKKGESHLISSRQYIHGKAWSISESEINSNIIVTGMSINTLILFEKWSQIFSVRKRVWFGSLVWQWWLALPFRSHSRHKLNEIEVQLYSFEENIFNRIYETLKITISQWKIIYINLKIYEEVHSFQDSFTRFSNKDFEGCDFMTEFLGSFPLWLSCSGSMPVSCLLGTCQENEQYTIQQECGLVLNTMYL